MDALTDLARPAVDQVAFVSIDYQKMKQEDRNDAGRKNDRP